MNPRIELLLWATRIVGKKDAQPHELLEIKADATLDEAQAAFHKIARMAHPDLHRGMDTEDLDRVTSAYGQVANAYQMFRAHKLRPGAPVVSAKITTDIPRQKRPTEQPAAARTTTAVHPPTAPPAPPRTTTSMPRPVAGPPPPLDKKPAGSAPAIKPPAAAEDPGVAEFEAKPGSQPAPETRTQMSSKALVYYRKAEMSLRQGDLRAGILNLKMAIAADPHSHFLRQALTNLEQELKKQ